MSDRRPYRDADPPARMGRGCCNARSVYRLGRSTFAVVLGAAMVAACSSSSSPRSSSAPATHRATATLRELADRRHLLIGSAVADRPLRTEADYRHVLAREFNLVEPEDVMKWSTVHPARDTYDFTAGDRLVRFAEQHGMKVRGHNLVWENFNPAWLTALTPSRPEAIALLRDHITAVVSHYRGKIAQWDVVNEALAEGDHGSMRDGVWLRWIGPEYVPMAFRFAHDADPSAQLFYNDYDWRSPGPKTDHILELAQHIRETGAPIDGVGIQLHVLHSLKVAAELSKLRAIARAGFDVAMTEVDNRRKLPTTTAALDDQERKFGDLLGMCLAIPRCRTFNLWGFTDRHSWIPGSFPGFGAGTVMDKRLRPKPAFFALRRALLSR